MSSTSRFLLTIDTDADPFVPGRILGLVAQHNVCSPWFSARQAGDERLRIVLELYGFDAHAVQLMTQRIANIPSVLSVVLRTLANRTDTLT